MNKAGWLSALPMLASALVSAEDERLQQGEYLLHAGGCITCHTLDGEQDKALLAGGRALETPFGVFYSPNITPDTETGIGHWSDDEFIQAFREGVNPEGDHYFPVFPYPSFSGIRDEDLLAIKTYLFSLPPIRRENRSHELRWYLFRFTIGPWNWLYFEPGEFQPDPAQSTRWNRGAYLVRHLGHCGECHTPRNWSGARDSARELAGNPHGPEDEAVPNITPHPQDGIGGWSQSDIEYFLEIGMLPDGDFAGSAMSDVIDDNTSHLTAEDRAAIAVYLLSLPAKPSAVE